jgi:phosphohistidine phosphatase
MTAPADPSFRLFLLRHAHAAWPQPGKSDFDRLLDARGRAEATEIAGLAQHSGLKPYFIISSPAERCRQTSEIMAANFPGTEISIDSSLYSGGVETYMDLIQRHSDKPSVMIVGHNPTIEALAEELREPGSIASALALGYPTAGLLVLDFQRPIGARLLHGGKLAALLVPSL